MKTYENYPPMATVQAMLPESFRFARENGPVEETFQWRNSLLHVDRLPNPAASHKIILHHGVGTNGRLLSMIVGLPLQNMGYEIAAIDMPLYGMSENNEPTVTYEDWIDVSLKFIDSESKRDGKPVVLYGLSAGGMLAYHVACLEPRVRGIVGMCFLNLQDKRVTDMISPFPLVLERTSVLSLKLVGAIPLMNRLKVPMKAVCKMSSLANDDELLKILLRDQYSAGAWVPFNFLKTLFGYRAPVAPEQFDTCPVLLTQPAADHWTPLEASRDFFDRLVVPKSLVMLENGGHYPVETPAVEQLVAAIDEFIRSQVTG
jgi:alpha-beta hydrolase superfamily lysophospholipase